jgi:hypothetical protein
VKEIEAEREILPASRRRLFSASSASISFTSAGYYVGMIAVLTHQ